MRKKIALVFVSVLALFALAGCEDKNKPEDYSSLAKEDYAEAFNEVVGVNLPENILAKHERFKITCTYYDSADQQIALSETTSFSNNKYLKEDSNGYIEYYGDKESYGYDNSMKMPYSAYFIDDSLYQEYFDDIIDKSVYVSNQYNIVDISEEDGKVTFVGQLTYDELNKIQGSSVSWLGENEIYQARFIVDKDSLEASKVVYEILKEDGSTLSIAEMNYEYDVDDFKATDDLYTRTHGEGRTVTIIKDPDSKSEETFTVKVPLKCDVKYIFDDSIEYYYDKEKTNIYTYDMHNTDSDETIYCFSSSDKADETSDTSKGE